MDWFGILKIGNTYPSPRFTTFMVHDSVWDSANMVNNVGGIRELEMSLGRKLTVKDFTNVPVNWSNRYWNEWKAKNATPDEINADADSITRKKEILGEEGRKKLARNWLNSKHGKWAIGSDDSGYKQLVQEAKKIIGVD